MDWRLAGAYSVPVALIWTALVSVAILLPAWASKDSPLPWSRVQYGVFVGWWFAGTAGWTWSGGPAGVALGLTLFVAGSVVMARAQFPNGDRPIGWFRAKFIPGLLCLALIPMISLGFLQAYGTSAYEAESHHMASSQLAWLVWARHQGEFSGGRLTIPLTTGDWPEADPWGLDFINTYAKPGEYAFSATHDGEYPRVVVTRLDGDEVYASVPEVNRHEPPGTEPNKIDPPSPK